MSIPVTWEQLTKYVAKTLPFHLYVQFPTTLVSDPVLKDEHLMLLLRILTLNNVMNTENLKEIIRSIFSVIGDPIKASDIIEEPDINNSDLILIFNNLIAASFLDDYLICKFLNLEPFITISVEPKKSVVAPIAKDESEPNSEGYYNKLQKLVHSLKDHVTSELFDSLQKLLKAEHEILMDTVGANHLLISRGKRLKLALGKIIYELKCIKSPGYARLRNDFKNTFKRGNTPGEEAVYRRKRRTNFYYFLGQFQQKVERESKKDSTAEIKYSPHCFYQNSGTRTDNLSLETKETKKSVSSFNRS